MPFACLSAVVAETEQRRAGDVRKMRDEISMQTGVVVFCQAN